MDLDVPPLFSPVAIAAAIAHQSTELDSADLPVVRVERRWVAPGLPDWELLDACAWAWGFLDGLLAEAESRFIGTRGRIDPYPVRRPDCMAIGPDSRSAVVSLATGEVIEHKQTRHEVTEDEFGRVEQRYGDAIRAIPRADRSLASQVGWFHAMARVLLERDGYHATMAFVRRDGRTIQTITMTPDDQNDKYLLMDRLARVVDSTAADELIFVTELWLAVMVEPSDPRVALRPAERQDRLEALSTVGLNRSGEMIEFQSMFSKEDDQVVLSESESVEQVAPFAFEPILKIWRTPQVTAPNDVSP
jgi:hypothetical protein